MDFDKIGKYLCFILRHHPEKIGTMIWAAEDNKADSRTLETIGYAKQRGPPLAIVSVG